MLLKAALKFAAESGADIMEADLKTLDLPIYDFDIQYAGMPESVLKLKAMIKACDVILIASPEYNYSISGALKNAIDWVSRVTNEFDGKYAAFFGASTGPMGTIRGQFALRLLLTGVNVNFLSQPQVFVGNAAKAFNADGSLAEKPLEDQLRMLVSNTIKTAEKLK
jgi:chromate reductase